MFSEAEDYMLKVGSCPLPWLSNAKPDKSHEATQCISCVFRVEECDFAISAAMSRMYTSPGNISENRIHQGNIGVITTPTGAPVNIKVFVL